MTKYIEIYKPYDIRYDEILVNNNIEIIYLGHNNWRLLTSDGITFDYLKTKYKYYKLRTKQKYNFIFIKLYIILYNYIKIVHLKPNAYFTEKYTPNI